MSSLILARSCRGHEGHFYCVGFSNSWPWWQTHFLFCIRGPTPNIKLMLQSTRRIKTNVIEFEVVWIVICCVWILDCFSYDVHTPRQTERDAGGQTDRDTEVDERIHPPQHASLSDSRLFYCFTELL